MAFFDKKNDRDKVNENATIFGVTFWTQDNKKQIKKYEFILNQILF